MPHSLKSKVKSLCYKGEITEKERDKIIHALEQTELNSSYNGVKSELKPCEEENPTCTECRYYDKEKHHCPRFCRVIENTMAEITSGQTKWIPISEKPQEGTYLITGQYGKNRYVDIATFDGEDATDIMSWDSYSDEYKINKREHKVIAYMPLPEPYKESDEK